MLDESETWLMKRKQNTVVFAMSRDEQDKVWSNIDGQIVFVWR